jgi:hypothetical protein
MRAAALAGKGQGPRPSALNDALACERLSLPLVRGGLLDQPYARTKAMLAAKAAFDAFRLHAQSAISDVDFSKQYPGAWELVTYIENISFDN